MWGGPKNRLKTEAQNYVNKNFIYSDAVTTIFTSVKARNEAKANERQLWNIRLREYDAMNMNWETLWTWTMEPEKVAFPAKIQCESSVAETDFQNQLKKQNCLLKNNVAMRKIRTWAIHSKDACSS